MNRTACRRIIAALVAAPLIAAVVPRTATAAGEDQGASSLETVVVTARLRQEDAQSVPISLSVVDAATLEVTRTNNIQDLSQLVPSLNYVSPNPRTPRLRFGDWGAACLRSPSPTMDSSREWDSMWMRSITADPQQPPSTS